MLTPADVGEMRRKIQSGEINFANPKVGMRRISGRIQTELNNLSKDLKTDEGKRVYALWWALDRLHRSNVYSGHNKMYIDAQLGILQDALPE